MGSVGKGRGHLVVLPGGRATGGAATGARAPSGTGAAGRLEVPTPQPGSITATAAALAPAPPPSMPVVPVADPVRPPTRSEDEIMLEVPAAVVCARCGDADCFGCDPDEERSGFLTIVPWERPAGSALKRLWLTARVATHQPESFFEALPDGSIGQALRFALFAELVASTALFAIAAGALALFLPALTSQLLASEGSVGFVLRATVVGLPTVASLLVGAHALHALALDRAAHKAGAKSQRSRALRFGLYAAGWDIVLGPVGLVVLAFEGGFTSIRRVLKGTGSVPGRASRAFLRGAYGLTGEPSKLAMRGTFVGAAIACTLAAVALLVLGGAFVIALATRV